MARKSKGKGIPSSLRRTKAFLIFNLVLWGGIGTWYLFQPQTRQKEVSRLVGNLFDARKDITAVEVAWDLWQLYYSPDYVATPLSNDKAYVYGGTPAGSAGFRTLPNQGYVVGYNDALGNPLWAAYRMTDIEVKDSPPRPDDFHVDTRTVARIESSVYNRSGYDRGHLAPNYAIATHYGKQAQEETFLMSNITPQKHSLNAGLWKTLEQKIATNYPGRFGEVWVIAGPIFSARPERLQRRVAVPEAFYMIIVDESDNRVRAEAFILPQDATGADLDRYLVTIDEIEKRTGLDFLPTLPDDAENALEAKKVARVW